MESDLTVI